MSSPDRGISAEVPGDPDEALSCADFCGEHRGFLSTRAGCRPQSLRGFPRGQKTQTSEAKARTQTPCENGAWPKPGRHRRPSRPGPSLLSLPSLCCRPRFTPVPSLAPAQLCRPGQCPPSTRSRRSPLPSMPWAGAALPRHLAMSTPSWMGWMGQRTQAVCHCILRTLCWDKAPDFPSHLHPAGGTPCPPTFPDKCFRTEEAWRGFPLGLLRRCHQLILRVPENPCQRPSKMARRVQGGTALVSPPGV